MEKAEDIFRSHSRKIASKKIPHPRAIPAKPTLLSPPNIIFGLGVELGCTLTKMQFVSLGVWRAFARHSAACMDTVTGNELIFMEVEAELLSARRCLVIPNAHATAATD